MALGADHGNVVGMVVRKGMTLVAIGVVVGLAAALAASRLMAGLIYGVSALEPITFVGITSLLCAIALLATYFPARRAASIDPMLALRAD